MKLKETIFIDFTKQYKVLQRYSNLLYKIVQYNIVLYNILYYVHYYYIFRKSYNGIALMSRNIHYFGIVWIRMSTISIMSYRKSVFSDPLQYIPC